MRRRKKERKKERGKKRRKDHQLIVFQFHTTTKQNEEMKEHL